ncbi:isoaspartyl peptidase/L-asparaginase family protein [Membranihabitans marinus]|uniref:isoaspartyl peptidase/L-asparaginase family protein n=1 Tax=Membranihabitans marinus TaxID=1227546 RepID=UPI001F23EABC|nr:N(4)-(beta-N-acetylglucosaminyl)-L-asparaginase [Membranihabitans marinus]
MERRNFINKIYGGLVGTSLLSFSRAREVGEMLNGPVVVSTWDFGMVANAEAWKILGSGGRSLDAVEKGVRIIESDVNNQTVGIGGLPDRDGYVTLDACIMDETGNAGSVSFLQDIEHPISVARKVMEDTPHVMLAGAGALQYALESGFEKKSLLTDKSKAAWEKWKKKSDYKPIINIENHDTIGMIAMDSQGQLSGACTTSGLAYKMHGRVGDSPVIGAGLYVDNEVGAATATGMGEAVLKTCGSFLVVELMRQGLSPEQACKEAVLRIAKKQNYNDFQIGFLALNKRGETGAYCIHPGFNYSLKDSKNERLVKSKSYIKG